MSALADVLRLKFPPVALLWSDEAPEGAVSFAPGKWGCVMWLLAAAAKGKTAAVDEGSFGCFGGGVGLGFGAQYENFPGGEGCFLRFLSTGNAGSEEGRAVAEKIRPHMRPEAFEEFLEGERYLKTPELTADFVANLPITRIPKRYVVLKPLADALSAGERVEVVVALADPDQLSALVVLANYGREGNENVIVPFAAGCQAVGIYPYREGLSAKPRGVVGMVDLSARLHLKSHVGPGFFTFAAPHGLWRAMEADAPGSFLDRPTWKHLAG